MTEQVTIETLRIPDCAHHWIFVRDWYGDPNVINGTADCSFFRCTRCGDQQTEQPDDYPEPEPPEREPEKGCNFCKNP